MGKYSGKETELICDQTVLIAFLSIVKADNQFKVRERAELCRIFQEEFGYSNAIAESLVKELEQISSDKDTFDESLSYFSEKQQEPRVREVLLEMLYRLASCDHHVSTEEEALLHRAGVLLQADMEACEVLNQRYLSHLTDGGRYQNQGTELWHVILGVPQDADLFEVREAYTNLMERFHPENLKEKKIDPLIINFARVKYHEIKEAFKQAEKELGQTSVEDKLMV